MGSWLSKSTRSSRKRSQYRRSSVCSFSGTFNLRKKSRSIVYSHDLSNRIFAFVGSSPASYRFAAALHAFLSIGPFPSMRSLASSLGRLCQIEIETRGAHSFRTKTFSRDWKALIMKERIANREEIASELSMLIERIRWNRLEKSSGLSEKIPESSQPSIVIKSRISPTYPISTNARVA